jgi:hypothetical protein
MKKLKSIRSSLSTRVALAAALGALGLAAAGTAWAASDGDGGGEKGLSAAPEAAPAHAAIAVAGPPLGPGPIGGPFGEDGAHEEFAAELAEHLDGVSAEEIESALGELADEHESERRTAMAESIAAELDGVEVSEVAAALEVAEEKMRAGFESGELPDPGLFAETLAAELGLSEEEINSALEAAHEIAFETERIGPGGHGRHGDVTMALPAPGGPGFGPPPGVAFELPAPGQPPKSGADDSGN